MVVGEAVLGRVLALDPTQVDVGCELVVAEQERIGAGGIAESGKAGKGKNRLANIKRADSVGAGDAEGVRAEVAVCNIDERLCARDLAGVAEVPVGNQIVGDGVAGAQPNVLDAA